MLHALKVLHCFMFISTFHVNRFWILQLAFRRTNSISIQEFVVIINKVSWKYVIKIFFIWPSMYNRSIQQKSQCIHISSVKFGHSQYMLMRTFLKGGLQFDNNSLKGMICRHLLWKWFMRFPAIFRVIRKIW